MPLSYTQTYELPLKLPGHAIVQLHEALIQQYTLKRLKRNGHRNVSLREEIATLQKMIDYVGNFIRIGGESTILIHDDYYGTLTLPPHHAHIKSKPRLLQHFDENNEFILNLPQTSIPVRKTDYAVGTYIRFKYKLDTHNPVIVNYQVK